MRRFPVTTLILVVAAIAVVGGWMLFAKSEHDRFVAVDQVRKSQSAFELTYTIDHGSGPIARETWHMHNDNGHSIASYAVSDRDGTIAKFDEPVTDYAVTFLFDKLVQDGIWDLQSRPFRGPSNDFHTVRIAQTAGTQSGSHQFVFSDPNYLATTAGREFHIHLDKNKPVPNVLSLESTSTADPRYGKIVADFEDFGSPSFKRTIAVAREKLLKSAKG
jgi:hypothetical protein